MKDARNQNSQQSKEPAINNNKPRPENKDNLDSRENLELNDAKEGGGHNKKATHQGDDAKNEQNDKRGTRPGR
jgi:hypothetical protein